MEDDFPSDATAAFDKLAALKRRYQQEPDPVSEALPALVAANAPREEVADVEDIPVLTEAVLIAEELAGPEIPHLEASFEAPSSRDDDASVQDAAVVATPPATDDPAAEALARRVAELLWPRIQAQMETSLLALLREASPAVYESWLDGLRRRSREEVLAGLRQATRWELAAQTDLPPAGPSSS